MRSELAPVLQEQLSSVAHDARCAEIEIYTSEYMTGAHKPLHVRLPTLVESRVRHDVTKSVRRGISTRFATKVDVVLHQALIDIFYSKPQRQGREINTISSRLDDSFVDIVTAWPVADYGAFMCPAHNMQLLIAQNTRPIAFAEIVRCKTTAIVLTCMGHANYLRDGVMNRLFVDLMIALYKLGVTTLFYGKEKLLGTKSALFLRGLGITNVGAV